MGRADWEWFFKHALIPVLNFTASSPENKFIPLYMFIPYHSFIFQFLFFVSSSTLRSFIRSLLQTDFSIHHSILCPAGPFPLQFHTSFWPPAILHQDKLLFLLFIQTAHHSFSLSMGCFLNYFILYFIQSGYSQSASQPALIRRTVYYRLDPEILLSFRNNNCRNDICQIPAPPKQVRSPCQTHQRRVNIKDSAIPPHTPQSMLFSDDLYKRLSPCSISSLNPD